MGAEGNDGPRDEWEPQTRPRLRLRGDLAARQFEDETVVLDLRSSTYLSTNPTGSVLWQALASGATREELVTALLNEFEVERERAVLDVDEFLEECRRRGLLTDESALPRANPN